MPPSLLLSTAYFPPISWFALASNCGSVTIEAFETYRKQSFRNRCNILGPNGLQALTVPVSKPSGNHSKTREVIVASELDWKRQHLRSIETAYNSSPFYLYYRDRITKTLLFPNSGLIDLNLSLIKLLCELTGITLKLEFTNLFEKNPSGITDLRNAIQPGNPLPACLFPVYNQVFSTKFPFMDDLSILDLLCNEGPASHDYLKAIAPGIKNHLKNNMLPSTYSGIGLFSGG